jgi:hypothetical protein
MNRPSLNTLRLISKTDKNLFKSLLEQIGFKVHTTNTYVESIANSMPENLNEYMQSVKNLAEQQGYIVSLCTEILDSINKMNADHRMRARMDERSRYLK